MCANPCVRVFVSRMRAWLDHACTSDLVLRPGPGEGVLRLEQSAGGRSSGVAAVSGSGGGRVRRREGGAATRSFRKGGWSDTRRGALAIQYLRALLACAEPGRSCEGARKREGPNERAREGVRATREAERGGDRCRYRCQVWKGVREAAARERSDGHMPPRGTSTEQSAARVLTMPAQSRYRTATGKGGDWEECSPPTCRPSAL